MQSRVDPWEPEGFEQYVARYPATPSLALPEPGPSRRFRARWRGTAGFAPSDWRAVFAERAPHTTVALVRGFLGNWMPGNLVAPIRTLEALGFRALLVRSRAGGPAARNAAALARRLRREIDGDPSRRLVIGGHSRGGLEARLALAADDDLLDRCDGVLTSQTPRGPSPVLESMLLGLHADTLAGPRRRLAETTQRLGLGLIGAAPGGRELTGEGIAALVERVESLPRPYPVLQTASWSSTPTTWLDSFHERLGEIAPGRAHDGQFFLDDLIWPDLPHVLLPRLDHAQPAMGGHGFDHVRYWLVVLSMILDLPVPEPPEPHE